MEHFYDALRDLNENVEEQLDHRFEGLRLFTFGCSNLLFLVLAQMIDDQNAKWTWILNALADIWQRCVASMHAAINRLTAVMNIAAHRYVRVRSIVLYCCNIIVSRVLEVLSKTVVEGLEVLALLSPTIAIVALVLRDGDNQPLSMPIVVVHSRRDPERIAEPITWDLAAPASFPWNYGNLVLVWAIVFFGWPLGLACIEIFKATLQLLKDIAVFVTRQWRPTVASLVRSCTTLKQVLQNISGFLYALYLLNAGFYFYLFLIHWDRGFVSRAEKGTFDPLNQHYEYSILASTIIVYGNNSVPTAQLCWKWIKRLLHHAGLLIEGRVATFIMTLLAAIAIVNIFVAVGMSTHESLHVWCTSITDPAGHSFNLLVLLSAWINYVKQFFVWIAHRMLTLHDRLEKVGLEGKEWLWIRRVAWIDGSNYPVAGTVTVLAVCVLWRALWNLIACLKLRKGLKTALNAGKAFFDDAMMVHNAGYQRA